MNGPLPAEGLRILEAQLGRMRGMLYRYYELFFRFLGGGMVAVGALFIGSFWGRHRRLTVQRAGEPWSGDLPAGTGRMGARERRLPCLVLRRASRPAGDRGHPCRCVRDGGPLTPLVWLVLAVAAGAAAYVVGWQAMRSYRSREARDLNAERYLAWRGRARPRPASESTREGMTRDERRRLVIGAVLAVVAVAALLAFFVAS